MNALFKHMKHYPEIIPVVGCVAAGVVLSGSYIGNLLFNHNDIYVDHRTPIKARFDKECPRIVTKDTTNSLDKLPFVSVLTIKSPFDK